MIYSFGLLLPVISTTFGAGKTEASLVHTLMSLMTLGSGPVVAEAIKKFGHCLVSVVGTLLAMAGLAAAGLYVSHTNEPAIAMLYLFVGILTGFGFGLMYTTAMDIIERYFDQHLGLANGIAAAGSGLGQFALAQLLHFILQRLSLPHTFFCLAGLVAVALPFMLIYRTPSEQEGKHAEPADTQQLDDVKTRNPSSTISSIVGLCGSYLMLLRNTAVLLLLISSFLVDLGVFSVPVFTTDRAEAWGLDSTTTSFMLSIIGITNCLGCVLWGPVMDK